MIVAGIGFNNKATAQSLAEALAAALRGAGLAHVDALASAPAKITDARLIAFARGLSLPLLAVDVAGTPTPSQSLRVLSLIGAGSLAEAAALVAAGAGSTLAAPRSLSPCRTATCAIALSKDHP